MTRKRRTEDDPPEIEGAPDRCFWCDFKVNGVPHRAFVGLCDGTAWDGNPEDCTCEGREAELRRLKDELRLVRHRAAVAEEALEHERLGNAEARRWLYDALRRLREYAPEAFAARPRLRR